MEVKQKNEILIIVVAFSILAIISVAIINHFSKYYSNMDSFEYEVEVRNQ